MIELIIQYIFNVIKSSYVFPEYADINEKLDQLHSVLDCLEKKNRSIQAGLMELLQSNREARKQFQEALKI